MTTEKRTIIREKLVKPSMVAPTLFVGLGGCGCKIVRRVIDHVRRRPDFLERFSGLTKSAFVDTNINDLEIHREVADDTFLISDFEKKAYADLAGGKDYLDPDPYFTQWVPRDYKFRSGDTAGAGQIRIESRLGSYYQVKHRDFVPKFRRILEAMKAHEHGHRRLDVSEIRIVICYSVAGGTGSGSHLPIAYLLRDMAAQFGKPIVIGVAVLPSVFEDKTGANKDGTFANGYAALKETEHLMRLGAPETRFAPPDKGVEFHYNPANPTKTHVIDKPFDFLYVIDRPESMTVKSVEAAAADGLYLQLYSPLFGEQAGDYDNYTQHQRFLVPQDFEAKGIPGYTSFYGSYGAAVLHIPSGGLVEYCAHAATLSLIRESFVAQIPSSNVYDAVRTMEEAFYQVTITDDPSVRDNKPIREAEFSLKLDEQRRVLEDRLFQKRVRMLAAAEVSQDKAGEYLAIFRHGHPLTMPDGKKRVLPSDTGVTGGDELRADELKAASESPLKYSIAAVALAAFAARGAKAGTAPEPHLLALAKRRMDERGKPLLEPQQTKVPVAELNQLVSNGRDGLLSAAKQLLEKGSDDAKGFELFDGLRFLDSANTGEISLAAKRYAVIAIRDALGSLPRIQGRPAKEAAADKGGQPEEPESEHDLTKKLSPDEQGEVLAAAFRKMKKELDREVEDLFYARLRPIYEELVKLADTLRMLQQGLMSLRPSKERFMERLSQTGDEIANQYILDAEALQIESGRRLWDYYYEDAVVGFEDVTLKNRSISAILSDGIKNLSKVGGGDSTLAEKVYEDLLREIRKSVRKKIEGDIYSEEVTLQKGLTLEHALELEVEYRALYLSQRDDIDKATDKRALIAKQLVAYRAKRQRLNLKDALHFDYLKDKVKRIVKERSELLCYLDEKHLQQGGIRPDEVFLCAIHRDLEGGVIGDILKKGLGINPPKPVTNDWENLREVIFYRAILCVPLFVFGRMKEMQAYYHQFKNASRRSKVLHIDLNWENTLPDLDPEDIEEAFRKQFLRDRIVDFAALLALEKPGATVRCIGRVDGQYELRSLAEPVPGADGEDFDNRPEKLGDTIEQSARRLKEVLDAEAEKYADYRQFLELVRAGCSPETLVAVVRVPFEWKKTVETMRTRFGDKLDDEQRRRLKDYENAHARTREALGRLRDSLRLSLAEQQATGDRPRVATAFSADEYLELANESVRLLDKFIDEYDNPDRASSLASNPFKHLFEPIGRKRLDETLRASLRPRRVSKFQASTGPATPPVTGLPQPADASSETKR